jgi:hypothetical protein
MSYIKLNTRKMPIGLSAIKISPEMRGAGTSFSGRTKPNMEKKEKLRGGIDPSIRIENPTRTNRYVK